MRDMNKETSGNFSNLDAQKISRCEDSKMQSMYLNEDLIHMPSVDSQVTSGDLNEFNQIQSLFVAQDSIRTKPIHF